MPSGDDHSVLLPSEYVTLLENIRDRSGEACAALKEIIRQAEDDPYTTPDTWTAKEPLTRLYAALRAEAEYRMRAEELRKQIANIMEIDNRDYYANVKPEQRR